MRYCETLLYRFPTYNGPLKAHTFPPNDKNNWQGQKCMLKTVIFKPHSNARGTIRRVKNACYTWTIDDNTRGGYLRPDWSAWSNWSDCSATCGQNSSHYRYRTCLNGVDVIENEFCAGRNRIEAPCSYVPCPDDVTGNGPDVSLTNKDVPLAPDVPGFEIDPEEEIEDPYSDEKKTPDEDKEIPDIDRPSSDPIKLSSISPSSTGRVSPTETTTSMKKTSTVKKIEADETTVTQSVRVTASSSSAKPTTEMTSSIKPVGLYYEKKQPNQIETRNQFKTHDEIDRCFIFSGKYDEMGDQIMNEMDCVNETLDEVFVASRKLRNTSDGAERVMDTMQQMARSFSTRLVQMGMAYESTVESADNSIKELTDRLAELENKNSELQRLVDQLVEKQL